MWPLRRAPVADHRLEENDHARSFELRGRVAVITGGGGILCSEMAGALAARGVKVAILDIDEAAARSVADGIRQNGGTAVYAVVDTQQGFTGECAMS